ncbi:hypothetical protein ABEB36_006358 [Hypothenemus hampei]|uniref:Uncharacterized protein n=1 Tax=Hypothenemus hampei TaxID=57062 RepID=A0ABD1EQ94_HYPHA
MKALNRLRADPTEIKRRLKTLRPTGYNVEVNKMILFAEAKLCPIIEYLFQDTDRPDQFIKIRQCDDIEQTYLITQDIIKALTDIGFEVGVNLEPLDMEKYRKRANVYGGSVYVDTTLLLGILELGNFLNSIKRDLEEFYRSVGVHSLVQTESGMVKIPSKNSKIVFKFKKTQNYSPLTFLKNDFFVMPTESLTPLVGSSSQLLRNRQETVFPSRSSKSLTNFRDNEVRKVTDIYGAQEILTRCIYDLQDINDYLNKSKQDAYTVYSTKELTESQKFQEVTSLIPDLSKSKCCCPECIADMENVGDECQQDQVIICIKGCNENEDDVQIIIRQCPECKAKEQQPTLQTPDTTTTRSPSPLKNTEEVRWENLEPIRYQEPKRNQESNILHNVDSKGTPMCSDEEDDKTTETPLLIHQNISCSKIKLFETANLCLKTEDGQELMISLTITPKHLNSSTPKAISLTDIFSDSDNLTKQYPLEQKPITYFVPDRYVPLYRTKVCSSLDFDVSLAESRIRDKRIKNQNNGIVVQLQEIGPDQLLRACRPAKCCRKAVLDEKMKKCLPYAPSVRSLPLDEDDLEVINQSLQMSLQKVKNSINLKKEFKHVVNNVWCLFVDQEERVLKILIKRKLDYCINLLNDLKESTYNVYYFGVNHKNGNIGKKESIGSIFVPLEMPDKKHVRRSKIPIYRPLKLPARKSLSHLKKLPKSITLIPKRRKKKEFYLPRSRSEISVKADLGLSEDTSKVILNYFSKMLYEMIKRQSEDKLKNACVATSIPSIKEIYIKSMFVGKTISLQTSRCIWRDTKICQTPSSTFSMQMEPLDFEKRMIFNKKKLNESNATFDEMRNIMVFFQRSSQSFNSELVTLSDSLMKLKETLEKYEDIKKGLPKETQVNPVEYFVYQQTCACDRLIGKKPSMLQKLLSKSKDFFSSTFSKRCQNCGCSLSKCQYDGSGRSCSCPKRQRFYQKQSSKFTKLFSRSSSSTGSLMALRKKLSGLSTCKCATKQQDGSWESNKVELKEKSTKDSGTQKCECPQCKSFLADGTCCCSHCIGCRDKSFNVTPQNEHVSVGTDPSKSNMHKLAKQEHVETFDLNSDQTPPSPTYFFMTPPSTLFNLRGGADSSGNPLESYQQLFHLLQLINN